MQIFRKVGRFTILSNKNNDGEYESECECGKISDLTMDRLLVEGNKQCDCFSEIINHGGGDGMRNIIKENARLPLFLIALYPAWKLCNE